VKKLIDQQSWLYFNKAIQPSASMTSLTSLNQYVPTCEFPSRETQAVHVINVVVDQERVGLSSLRLVCLAQLQFCLKNGSKTLSWRLLESATSWSILNMLFLDACGFD
jgi:hypothetical protein